MCLITKKYSEIKTAEEDIICYKILVKKDKDGYFTPFMGVPVKLGETYTEPHFLKYDTWSDGKLKYIVRYGFHSLQQSDKDKVRTRMAGAVLAHDYCIVKCIIPKGSLYVKGSSNFALAVNTPSGYDSLDFEDMPSYASEKIIYKEICV